MKVAYLFGSLNRGGTETLKLDVCKNLKKDDFQAVGIYRKGGVLEQDFIDTEIPFFYLSTDKNILRYLWRLRKLIVSQQIDIVHAQQPIDALYAKLACLFIRKKIILTFHGFDFNSNLSLLKYIIKRTNRNIFVSKHQQNYYIEKYKLNPLKQAVVYNGIDLSKLENKPSGADIRKELKISNDTLLLAMVGNFNEVRDQFTVCRFLKLLNEQKVDFRFLFVGIRVDNEAYRFDRCVDYCSQHGLQDKVLFLGVRNDVPLVLRQLDAFIYSTEHDTFGIAVVEAMIAGVPVLVNDWEVINEITEQGKHATLYKSGDVNDLLEKFMVYLQNKEDYKHNAVTIAKIVKENYSIQKHIETLKGIYKAILE